MGGTSTGCATSLPPCAGTDQFRRQAYLQAVAGAFTIRRIGTTSTVPACDEIVNMNNEHRTVVHHFPWLFVRTISRRPFVPFSDCLAIVPPKLVDSICLAHFHKNNVRYAHARAFCLPVGRVCFRRSFCPCRPKRLAILSAFLSQTYVSSRCQIVFTLFLISPASNTVQHCESPH